jgi:hypothetical protein
VLRRTAIRAERIYKEIEEVGCLTSAAIAERLRVSHSELFYVLNALRREGRVEIINLGRVALWCADRTASEEVLSRLAEALRSLLCGRRFATPKEALQLAAEDKETRKLFSRHMPLRPNPTTMQVIDALMAKAFGEPIKRSRSRIYHIQCAEKSTGTDPRG